jgi:MBOAT, membrane-bound O-acyltransferase family
VLLLFPFSSKHRFPCVEIASSVPQLVKDQVVVLSDALGFDVETCAFTLCLFLCYPFGIIMNMLPYGNVRHAYSFLVGCFFCQLTVGSQWVHFLISTLAVYFMLLLLPRKTSATVVPVFVMGYCVLGHLHRQYVDYLGWTLDFTGTQMVLTQKLWMIAYNIFDGEVLAQGKESRAAQKCAPFSLKEVPNLLEYMGYMFCFSNILTGPSYEFTTYRNAIDGSLLYFPDGKPRGKIPSNVWPTIKPLLISLGCLAVFVLVGSKFPLADPTDPKGSTPVVLTAEFLAKPWIQRYGYMWIALMVAVRQKYYFAWMNAEGANNIWYAGFDGFDDKGNALGWEVSANTNIWKFETATNVASVAREWNKKTSLWLNRYVYIRTNGSLVAVYSMSAFWHGFYPGYYLFFLSVPLVTVCERLGKKKISPYFSSEKWSVYGICCMIFTSLTMEYLVSAFVLLALDRTLANWKSHYFFGHIGAVIFYGILQVLPTPKTATKKKEE